MQDDRIHDDVCRQIMWQTDIQSREIEVRVKNSVVLLSGRVETCLERLEAENAAKAVYGVISVTNNIQVEPKCVRTDDEIAADVVAGLRMVTCVLEDLPIVSVRDGVVVLRGEVRWNFQRAGAERAAEAVVGVRRVHNLIEVAPLSSLTKVASVNALVPCRQAGRRRPDTTPSSLKGDSQSSTESSRSGPLFFVSTSIGRA